MPDPHATRRALLDAARDEFAAHGVAGARVDRIAAAAGVNKQRIYGHFGNKDGLFTAVLDDALDHVLALVTLPDGEAEPGALLRAYVERISRHHRDHPELLRLLQWEALERPRRDSAPPECAARYREKTEGFARRLGLPLDQAAPLLFGLIGLAAWPQVLPQLAELVVGADDGARPAAEQTLAWAADTAERAGSAL